MVAMIHTRSALALALGAMMVTAAAAQTSGLPKAPQTTPPAAKSGKGHGIDSQMLLDRLFGQLNKAENVETAKVVEKAIWGLWSQSSSPTANALLGQASKAMAASNFRVAIKLLDTAIELKPDFAEAWNKRATAFYLDGNFKSSMADIERVLELEPRHFGALSGLGLIQRELGDEEAALKAFRRALAIHPHLPAANRAVKELETEFEQRI